MGGGGGAGVHVDEGLNLEGFVPLSIIPNSWPVIQQCFV